MFEFERLCKTVEDMDPKTYNAIIFEKSARIIDALTFIMKDDVKGINLFIELLLGAVVSDGMLAREEYFLIKPLLELALGGRSLSFDEALEYIAYVTEGTEEHKAFVNDVTDRLGEISDELKGDIVMVCMMVCGVDGDISRKEKKWLKELIK